MKKKFSNNYKFIGIIAVVFIIGALALATFIVDFYGHGPYHHYEYGHESFHNMHSQMHSRDYQSDSADNLDNIDNFITLSSEIRKTQREQGNYACCLQNPCTYCIAKTPEHGLGAGCECLDDVMNGNHPCGECIGEILEGKGNKFIAEHFAEALADELGEQYLPVLKQIIDEKYDLGKKEQI